MPPPATEALTTPSGPDDPTPVLLLKTESAPGDAYRELLTSASAARRFDPYFVPVLSHRFNVAGLAGLADLLRCGQIGRHAACAYGGLVFTSQRAVDALARVVDDGRGPPGWPHLQDVPVYSVGPATTRALEAIPQQPPLQVFGQHCGNGDALSRFILEHYYDHHNGVRLPLLFLVGEQRRDVITRSLMDPALPEHGRIRIDELVVYGSCVMESFSDDFAAALLRTSDAPLRWVVVFSPTGCDTMLRGLDLLSDGAQARLGRRHTQTRIATIGPTTKAHLADTFGLDPDVCAETPSPQGVLQAILNYMNRPMESSSQ